MKRTIQISLPTDISSPIFLLYEISNTCIFSVWFTKNPHKIVGVSYHELSKEEDESEAFQQVHKENVGMTQQPLKTYITYNFKEMLLVPKKHLNSGTLEAMLDLVFGNKESVIVTHEKMVDTEIEVVYSIPSSLEAYVTSQISGAEIFHTNSKLQSKSFEDPSLTCVVYPDFIKVVLYKDHQIQLVQSFDYTTPEDAAYHVLNCCKQFNLAPSEVILSMSGLIVKESNLYQCIYNYVKGIEWNLPKENEIDIDINEEMPIHFFSHLIHLVSCV